MSVSMISRNGGNSLCDLLLEVLCLICVEFMLEMLRQGIAVEQVVVDLAASEWGRWGEEGGHGTRVEVVHFDAHLEEH